jgi:hypothetical protein
MVSHLLSCELIDEILFDIVLKLIDVFATLSKTVWTPLFHLFAIVLLDGSLINENFMNYKMRRKNEIKISVTSLINSVASGRAVFTLLIALLAYSLLSQMLLSTVT